MSPKSIYMHVATQPPGPTRNRESNSLADGSRSATFEPRYEKTGFLLMQKQRRRSAYQRLCFRYTDSTIPLLPKSEISSI